MTRLHDCSMDIVPAAFRARLASSAPHFPVVALAVPADGQGTYRGPSDRLLAPAVRGPAAQPPLPSSCPTAGASWSCEQRGRNGYALFLLAALALVLGAGAVHLVYRLHFAGGSTNAPRGK